jgi:erythromycin esterase-like protein
MRRAARFRHEQPADTDRVLAPVRSIARPLHSAADLDPLLDRIGDARHVLLGEASHGTAEYYNWRAILSQRLIREKGFSFIAVEGDWPDCYRVNRYVKHYPDGGTSAHDVLHAFERWPTWMWANREVVGLAEWLAEHNASQPAGRKVGFYGLDVYSLWDSLYAVMGHLRKHHPDLLPAARRAFQCFEPYGEDVQDYARATSWLSETCEDEVVDLLRALQENPPRHDGDPEGCFVAEQNALVVRNAEAYYRAMVRSGPDSWNVRDRHMAETLQRLMRHHGDDARCIVWEHNTHIGDARYTDMAAEGMVNLGELVREANDADDVVLVGFGSYEGSVIAAEAWEAPMQKMPVPPAREGSWEDLLHGLGGEDRLLVFAELRETRGPVFEPRGHRAIGVVYNPDYERFGNYVPTVLPRRYDAFLYFDRTEAVHPLHFPVHADAEAPETYPSGV